MGIEQPFLDVIVYLMDGQSFHYRQANLDGIEETVEHLRRTKVFTQRNLVVHTEQALITFPSHAVARLDIICPASANLPTIPIWNDATEITEAEFEQQRERITREMHDGWQKFIQQGAFPMLYIMDLHGGHRVYLQSNSTVEENGSLTTLTSSDLGMITQHTPPPVITIRRRNGGLIFLNPLNVVGTMRCPSTQNRPMNTLTFRAEERGISADPCALLTENITR